MSEIDLLNSKVKSPDELKFWKNLAERWMKNCREWELLYSDMKNLYEERIKTLEEEKLMCKECGKEFKKKEFYYV